ncbi:MAG: DUF6446 family protein [Pelagimonas sp.]|jgi:hypothetical protein|nr:DUF6446 family protein [Pelagimonas sp.]
MTGKILAGFIVVFSLIFGAAVYYMQVYHYYDEVKANGSNDVTLLSLTSGAPEPILYEGFQAIDAESSPIRYRACFTTSMSIPMLTETYELYTKQDPAPRNAPYWFDCFDSKAIGADIEAGRALVFTSQHNLYYGIDRVVAITDDGRGYIWHEINDCGDKAYDGTPLGENCPEREGN